jgi:CHAT domain-containing protein
VTLRSAPARAAVLAEFYLGQYDSYLVAYSPAWGEVRSRRTYLPRSAIRDAAVQLSAALALRSGPGPGAELQIDRAPGLAKLVSALVEWADPGQHLVLVPHDALHSLPLHTLPTPDGVPLVERNPVSYVPSATVLRFCMSHPVRSYSAAMAVVDSDDANPLPFARMQGSVVRDHIPSATVLEGPAASTDQVLDRLGQSPGLAHFALHGDLDPQLPMQSGLRLADGRLSAEAILRLRLGGATLALCGCQSGTSALLAGDELLGLTRSCLYAGARTLILSQWSIDDLSAAFLMDELYSRLTRGTGAAEAVRAAQLAVRDASAARVLDFTRRARQNSTDPVLEREMRLEEAELYLAAGDAAGAEAAVASGRGDLPGAAPTRVRAVRAKAALLRRAQVVPQLSKRVFDRPFYWAPFVVVGAWK